MAEDLEDDREVLDVMQEGFVHESGDVLRVGEEKWATLLILHWLRREGLVVSVQEADSIIWLIN